jgi:hypothetical protein
MDGLPKILRSVFRDDDEVDLLSDRRMVCSPFPRLERKVNFSRSLKAMSKLNPHSIGARYFLYVFLRIAEILPII